PRTGRGSCRRVRTGGPRPGGPRCHGPAVPRPTSPNGILPRMSRLLPIALLILAAAVPLAAQEAPALRVHHTFPEAGRTLQLAVEGLPPQAVVRLWLHEALQAPP